MSRVGKSPVVIPAGVKANVVNGVINVEGPKGKLSYTVTSGIRIGIDGGSIIVERDAEDRQSKSNHGSTRALVNNMVLGVTKGWKRSLELNGVGYNAKVQGQSVVLAVGFSHDVKIDLPKEIKATVTKNILDLESADRQLVGLFASKIRKVQPPEPYLGKGIKYVEETIRRKAGKTGKK